MTDEIKEEIINEASVPEKIEEASAGSNETAENADKEAVNRTAQVAENSEQPKAVEEPPQEVQPEIKEEPLIEPVKEEAVKTGEIAQETGGDVIAEAKQEEAEEPKWYIIQTLTGQEEKVRDRIESNIESLGLKEKVLRVLLPEEETVEIKGDKRIERKRKMYPGYIFVEMRLDEDAWYKIRNTTGVARFIGRKTTPQPVSDREMQRVLKQLGIKEKEITVEFEVGEPIRMISGSFRGYTGSVSEVNAAKSKLKAMINIFGRDTSVEVDFDRVEKVI